MSCSTVKVTTDYDTKVDFNKYKTFAFYKPGIDKAEISSLDKKRVLRAIESELLAQGLTISNKPDMLVSIFTKSRRKVNINQNNNNFGYGFEPAVIVFADTYHVRDGLTDSRARLVVLRQ